jgi:hypothetical protein
MDILQSLQLVFTLETFERVENSRRPGERIVSGSRVGWR